MKILFNSSNPSISLYEVIVFPMTQAEYEKNEKKTEPTVSLLAFILFLITITSDNMVINHANCLHKCITNGRADKLKAAFL